MDIGNLEQQVMLAIMRLNPDAYGVSVQEEIEKRTGRRPSTGSVYAAFARLQRKGYVVPRPGEATEERGGRAKIYFTLTGVGETALSQSLSSLDALRRGLRLRERPA